MNRLRVSSTDPSQVSASISTGESGRSTSDKTHTPDTHTHTEQRGGD